MMRPIKISSEDLREAISLWLMVRHETVVHPKDLVLVPNDKSIHASAEDSEPYKYGARDMGLPDMKNLKESVSAFARKHLGLQEPPGRDPRD